MAIKMVGQGSGAPGFSILKRPFTRFVRPVLGRRKVRTLQKFDEARAVTFPETPQNLERRNGYATANTGGNRGATQIHQKPVIGPTSDSRTHIKTPNPTNGGGIKKR